MNDFLIYYAPSVVLMGAIGLAFFAAAKKDQFDQS